MKNPKPRKDACYNERIRTTILDIEKTLSNEHVVIGRHFDTLLKTRIEVPKDEIIVFHLGKLFRKNEKNLSEV